jgi:hypothetical protein
MEDDQSNSDQWHVMAGSEEQANQQSHTAPNDVQRQQQQQLAYYAEMHRQRLAGGAGASRPQGHAAAALDALDENGHRIGSQRRSAAYAERLLEEEENGDDVQYRLADGRMVSSLSWAALKARSADWITQQIAWTQRTKSNAAVLGPI